MKAGREERSDNMCGLSPLRRLQIATPGCQGREGERGNRRERRERGPSRQKVAGNMRRRLPTPPSLPPSHLPPGKTASSSFSPSSLPAGPLTSSASVSQLWEQRPLLPWAPLWNESEGTSRKVVRSHARKGVGPGIWRMPPAIPVPLWRSQTLGRKERLAKSEFPWLSRLFHRKSRSA